MTRRLRWILFVMLVILGAGGVALTRPTPPYAGHVLYMRLRLAPYFGSYKEIQYWIDPAAGRVLYSEMMPNSGNVQVYVNHVLVKPAPPQWFVISLARQSGGACGVTYTTLLDSSERSTPIPCAGLLALRDVSALNARARALWHTHRAAAHAQAGNPHVVSVPVPAGTQLIPIITEDPSITPGDHMLPGLLRLDARTGRPLSLSGYQRGGPPMAEYILSARMIAPGTLPGNFFAAPAFSLPDRMPGLYQWLHKTLPWHP